MTSTEFYVCPECEVFFGSEELLKQHESIGCEDDDDLGSGYPTYCCGQIYEDGETACMSCGEPL